MTATKSDIHDMRAELRTALDRMDEINEVALSEDRDFNEQEQTEYSELEGRCDSLQKRIERQEQLRERRDAAPLPAAPDTRNAPKIHSVRDYDGTDFRSLAEFVHTAIFNPRDQRLQSQYMDMENRESPAYSGLEMGTPASGGYLVPDQFMTSILEFNAQSAVVRPRATVIPADSGSPDASVSIPVLDQSGENGIYAGVEVDWIEEGGEKPETVFGLDQITLTPHEVAAHIKVTDKALRNAPVLETLVRRLLTAGINAAEDHAFIQGDGEGKPTGYIGHESNVLVARSSANDVTYDDLVEMLSRMIFGGNPVWVVTQRVLPRLMKMEDTEGHLIWQPDARAGVPGTIFGYPVVVTNRAPALGATGDVSFVDLGYYLIKDGTGLMIAASPHVQFINNRTVIKAFKLVDGKPWPQSPLTDENDEEVSPFVVLDDPEAGDDDSGGDDDQTPPGDDDDLG